MNSFKKKKKKKKKKEGCNAREEPQPIKFQFL